MDLSSGKASVEEHGGTGDSHVADPFLALIVPMVDTDPAIRHSLQRVSPLTWPRHGQTRFHGKPPCHFVLSNRARFISPFLSRRRLPAHASRVFRLYLPGCTRIRCIYRFLVRSRTKDWRREEKVVFFPQQGESCRAFLLYLEEK